MTDVPDPDMNTLPVVKQSPKFVITGPVAMSLKKYKDYYLYV
jgi:hypothetical protein